MANDDAWQAGFDLRTQSKKKNEDASAKPGAMGGPKARGGGGVAGMIGRAFRGKSQGAAEKAPQGGNAPGLAKVNFGGGDLPVKAIGSFKKGGHVRKTGVYRLHKGEHVVPAKRSGKQASRKQTVIKG